MDADRLARRNFYLIIIEGAIFWAALAFIQGDTIVSMFMNTMTGSVALAGIAATIRSFAFLFGQFIVGMFIHKIRNQCRFMIVVAFFTRPLVLLIAPLLMMGLSGLSAAWIFIALVGLFFVSDGVVSVIWIEIGARTMDSRRRGMAMAITPAAAGFIGIFIAAFLRKILDGPLPIHEQYAIIFGCAGVLFCVNAVVLALFRDVPHPSHPEEAAIPLFPYIKKLLGLFMEDKQVRTLTISRMLYMMTMISAAINILYGGSTGLNEAQLVLMPVIGQIAAGFLWTNVSRFLSYPIMMLMGQLIGVLSALMNLLCLVFAALNYSVMVPLSLAMILVSVNNQAYIGFTQHMIALVDDEEKRPLYYVMTALVTAPFAFGFSLAAWIAEKFGYLPVYLIMLAAGVAGAALVFCKFIRKERR